MAYLEPGGMNRLKQGVAIPKQFAFPLNLLGHLARLVDDVLPVSQAGYRLGDLCRGKVYAGYGEYEPVTVRNHFGARRPKTHRNCEDDLPFGGAWRNEA